MSVSLVTAQFDTKCADNSAHFTVEQATKFITDDLIASGIAKRNGNEVFIKCNNHYFSIRDDGYIEVRGWVYDVG